MQSCCVSTLKLMQELKELKAFLTVFLKASPYLILIPEAGAGVLTDGVRETVKGQIQDMLIGKALDKVTGAGSLPDVQQALASVDKIVLGRLQGFAQIHYLRHGGTELKFWDALIKLYDPNNQPAAGGSWWNPFD